MSGWVAELVQLAGSVAAILAIAWLVRRMGLGAAHLRIRDEADAIRRAEEAEWGFGGVSAAVDSGGYAALVTNGDGAVMLLRAHGAHIAARRVTQAWQARLDRNRLELRSDERFFAPVLLDLGARAPVVAAQLRGVLGHGQRGNAMPMSADKGVLRHG